MNIAPHVRATLKENAAFADFVDDNGKSKFYHRNAPLQDGIFATIDMEYGTEKRIGWSTPYVTITFSGKRKDEEALWDYARSTYDIFKEADEFEAIGDDDPLRYELLGDAILDVGDDPMTDRVHVSVALNFGVVIE